MPADVAHAGRSVGYPIAALLLVAALLLTAGPQTAGTLSGPRTGSATTKPTLTAVSSPSNSGPFRVVALGDSVPAGSACDCTPYVSLVGRHEAESIGTTAAVSNLAVDGLTTDGLLSQLDDDSVGRQLAAADLVVITIGANDFDADTVADASCSPPELSCFQSALAEQESELNAALKKVNTLLGDEPASVLVTGYWNVFLDGDVAAANGADYVRNSVSLTRAENAQIAAAARAQGTTYVDIFTAFKGTSGTDDDTDLLADDGDHPNAAGHRRIAEALQTVLASA